MKLKSVSLLSLLLVSSLPVTAQEKAVLNAFTQAEVFAKQQKTFASSKDRGAKEQSHRSVTQIKSLTSNLTPAQLVDLVALCKKRVHETPSDSKHQPYSGYLESVMHLSIMRLGDIHSADAAKALDDLKPILAGAASLTESLTEAKAKQSGSIKP